MNALQEVRKDGGIGAAARPAQKPGLPEGLLRLTRPASLKVAAQLRILSEAKTALAEASGDAARAAEVPGREVAVRRARAGLAEHCMPELVLLHLSRAEPELVPQALYDIVAGLSLIEHVGIRPVATAQRLLLGSCPVQEIDCSEAVLPASFTIAARLRMLRMAKKKLAKAENDAANMRDAETDLRKARDGLQKRQQEYRGDPEVSPAKVAERMERKLAEIAAKSTAHQLPRLKSTVIGTYGDLAVNCMPHITFLHLSGAKPKVVETALGIIVGAGAWVRRNVNPAAIATAEYLLGDMGAAHVNVTNGASRAVDDASANIRHLMYGQTEPPVSGRPQLDAAGRAPLLASSALDIVLMLEAGRDLDDAMGALSTIAEHHGDRTKKAAASVMLARRRGASEAIDAASENVSSARARVLDLTDLESKAEHGRDRAGVVTLLASSGLEISLLMETGQDEALVRRALSLIAAYPPDERKRLAAGVLLARHDYPWDVRGETH